MAPTSIILPSISVAILSYNRREERRRTLIARADPDAVPELLQNIVLTGGGSLVRGLGVALPTLLIEDGYENPKVSVIGPDHNEQVARGALKAAHQAKDRQWQTILR